MSHLSVHTRGHDLGIPSLSRGDASNGICGLAQDHQRFLRSTPGVPQPDHAVIGGARVDVVSSPMTAVVVVGTKTGYVFDATHVAPKLLLQLGSNLSRKEARKMH